MLLTILAILAGCGASDVRPERAPTPSLARRAPRDAGADTGPSPTADRDGDRVIDLCDACPDDAEVFQGMADEDGCPDRASDDVGDPSNFWAAPVTGTVFARESARLPDAAGEAIAAAARRLREENVVRAACLGRADPTERAPARLAERRARALCDALRREGVEPATLVTVTRIDGARLPWDGPAVETTGVLLIALAIADTELWRLDEPTPRWLPPEPDRRSEQNHPPPPGCPPTHRPR